MPALSRRLAVLFVCVVGCRSTTRAAPASKSRAPQVASVAALAPKPPVAPTLRIGGTLTRGAAHSFELVVQRDGLVEAALSDEDGHALNEPARLSVTLPGSDGKPQRIALGFAPPRQRFQGHAAPGTTLASGAVDIELEHNGAHDSARLDHATVLFGPERGGHMLTLGAYGVELIPHASGRVEAFVKDAVGTAVSDPKLGLRASLLTKALTRSDLVLERDNACGCYAGRADSELRPGPLELALEGDAAARARLQQAALAPEPVHGGSVILAGFHGVELLVKPTQIELFVYDAFGKPYAASHLELMLAFDSDRAPLLVRLLWDPSHRNYRADISGRPALYRMPVRVSLTAGERSDLGGTLLRFDPLGR